MTAPRVALAGAVVLLVLAAWQVPQWLDWTRYRGPIEGLAAGALGQPVAINGPISLTLLPQPVLIASQVQVGGDATDLSIHVDALRLRIAPWPLLAGHIDARELVLQGPDLRLPWLGTAGPRPHPPSWLAGLSAKIEGGRLAVGQLSFTRIDATLATLETGALSAAGTARFSGHDWHFTTRLTAAGADGTAGLNVTLDGQGRAGGLGASFTGQWAQGGTLAGVLAIRGPDLGVLLPTPRIPFRADGRLSIRDGVAAAGDLALEIGGSPARGSVSLRVAPQPRLDVALAAGRLDLAAWLPVLLHARATIAGIDVPIGLNLSAEAAAFRGGTLERLRATVELEGSSVTLADLSTQVPGNGTLRLRGRLLRDDPADPRFDGDARLDAPVLRTTLGWLDQAMPGTLPPGFLALVPPGVLQRAELAAHVTISGREVALRRIAGSFDDASATGDVGLKRGEPPLFTADLSLDRLALDPWLPSPSAVLAGLAGRNPSFDAELRLTVGRATLAGTVIARLSVDAVMEAGNVTVRRLAGTARGAEFAGSGMASANGKLSGGTLTVQTKDASGLADLLPSAARGTPALWHGPARLAVRMAGPQDALAGEVRLSLADAQLEAMPVVNVRSGEWSSSLSLRHPAARRLVAALGLAGRDEVGFLPDWLGDGSLSLVARLGGKHGRILAEALDVRAATMHGAGGLAFDLSRAEPSVTGNLQIDALALPIPDGGSDVPLPLGLLHGWQSEMRLGIGRLSAGTGPVLQDVSTILAIGHEECRLKEFTAMLGSGVVSGSVTLDAAQTPPALAAQATLRNAAIVGPLADGPIDLLSGQADADVAVVANGYSPAVMLATLAGRFTMTAKSGALSGLDLYRLRQVLEKPDPPSTQAAAAAALRSGSTGFDRLEVGGMIANGRLLLDAGRLTGAAGEASLGGAVDLASHTLDLRLTAKPSVSGAPDVAVRLTGPIDRPSRATELADLARWIAATVH